MKVMFGKRLEVLEESRLVKSGKLTKRGWRIWQVRRVYEVLRRKYELGSEYGKEKIKMRNEKECGGSKQQEYIKAV